MSWEDEDFDVDLDDRRRFKQAGFSDEEDDDGIVKDAWDADSDDEKKAAAPAGGPAQPAKTKKKTIKQIAAEKETKLKAEAEARRKVHGAAREEEALNDEAEKARRQRLVEEADLENAKDLFGADEKPKTALAGVGIDAMNPKTKAEFDAFAKAITDKLAQYESAPLFAHCLENIFKESVNSLHYEDIRKLSAALNVIANQKQQAEKAKKTAGGKKKKGQIAKVGKDDGADEIDNYEAGGRYDDTYDDFI